VKVASAAAEEERETADMVVAVAVIRVAVADFMDKVAAALAAQADRFQAPDSTGSGQITALAS